MGKLSLRISLATFRLFTVWGDSSLTVTIIFCSSTHPLFSRWRLERKVGVMEETKMLRISKCVLKEGINVSNGLCLLQAFLSL